MAAWANAVTAMPSSAFMDDLGMCVANDGAPDGAARWLLDFVSNFLRKEGCNDGPIAAYDHVIHDAEAIAGIWPAVRFSCEQQPVPAAHVPPMLARFMVERLPALWTGPHLAPCPPATKALALADRIETLVSMFAVGNKPNGSKDPYALRRAAKEVLSLIAFPIMAVRAPTSDTSDPAQ